MPLRSFGSVSKAELLKQIFAPVTFSIDPQRVNAHAAALINGLNDLASMEFRLPPNFTTISQCILQMVGAANTNNMKIDIYADYALSGEQNNFRVATATVNIPVTVNGEIVDVEFAALEAVTDLAPNQLLGITAEYIALATFTNIYVLGATIRWR